MSALNAKLCVNPRCRLYGEHWGGCEGNCTGCSPRPATIGNLCRPCCDAVGEHAIEGATLHAELELDLVSVGGGAGGGGGVNPFPSVSFNPGASATRDAIRNTLVGWCRVIGEELGYELMGWRIVTLRSGVQGPANRARIVNTGLSHLGEFINTHRHWLAAQPWVDEICDQLADLVHDGLRRQDHVQPSVVDVEGKCPQCDAPMTAIVRREMSSPTEAVCTGEEAHRWQGERALAELGRLVGARDSWVSARDIARRYKRPLGTIQRLSLAEGWGRTEDGQRPVLYKPEDVEKTMKRLGNRESGIDQKAGAA